MKKQSKATQRMKTALIKARILQRAIPFRGAHNNLYYAQPDGRITYTGRLKNLKVSYKI